MPEETQTQSEISKKPEETEKPKEQEEAKKEFKGLIEIKQRKENPVLDRQEIVASIKANRTPTKEEAQKLLASELKADQELISVKHIYSTFGSQEFNIIAYLYIDKETFQKLEVKKEKKVKGKEEKPEEEEQEHGKEEEKEKKGE